MLEELTREQAILEHRKLWEWIRDQTQSKKRVVRKGEYFDVYRDRYACRPKNDCFCCEYAFEKTYGGDPYGTICEKCPLEWVTGRGEKCMHCDDGVYDEWVEETDYKRAAILAGKISKLEVKAGDKLC